MIRTPLAPKGEQMTRERVFLQRVLNQHRKPVHALAHVGVAQRQCTFTPAGTIIIVFVSRSATWRRTVFRIAAFRRKNPPTIAQFDRRHAVGRSQQIVQQLESVMSQAVYRSP
jgi:hypothetical protein